jgi:hypothetical protein
MSLDNVLPMSLDNSVTYVPERFMAPSRPATALMGGQDQEPLRVLRHTD